MVLYGRARECETLERQLRQVRAGQSAVLVVRGDAGVGKTALLEHVAAIADGCRVARAGGVQSEMELPFAGLHHLCAPLLAGLASLPPPQATALRVAFGLDDGQAPDPFLVALATLSLLSEVAEEQPLVCLVDDAQWLDRASAQALAFVARRLLAERIAMVVAQRGPSDVVEFAGLPELVVGGLGDDDARQLLALTVQGRIDERVRDRIVAESRGNPLALLELPRGLTTAELAGGFRVPDAGSLSPQIEQSFLRRFSSLSPASQLLVVVAAAEPLGDVTLLWRAAEQLGIGAEALEGPESAGLLEVGLRVRFRHPLVRSAVYRAATVEDRQRAHRALADVTDVTADPDRRAWHRAYAATGLDEAVASDLEGSAARAQRRGGVAAAAAFLERAAELTPAPKLRADRMLAAAQAKLEAGAPDAANALLDAAALVPLDELQQALLRRTRAEVAFTVRRGGDVAAQLLDAAKALVPFDARLARQTCLEALASALHAGDVIDRGDVLHVVRGAPTPASPPAARPAAGRSGDAGRAGLRPGCSTAARRPGRVPQRRRRRRRGRSLAVAGVPRGRRSVGHRDVERAGAARGPAGARRRRARRAAHRRHLPRRCAHESRGVPRGGDADGRVGGDHGGHRRGTADADQARAGRPARRPRGGGAGARSRARRHGRAWPRHAGEHAGRHARGAVQRAGPLRGGAGGGGARL